MKTYFWVPHSDTNLVTKLVAQRTQIWFLFGDLHNSNDVFKDPRVAFLKYYIVNNT